MKKLTRLAQCLVAISLATLLCGLLMPGEWTAAAASAWDIPAQANGWFHTGMFAVLFAFIPPAAPRLQPWQLLVLALGLAVGTEAMQILAVGRDPSWNGVRQDLVGALMGGIVGMTLRQAATARRVRRAG